MSGEVGREWEKGRKCKILNGKIKYNFKKENAPIDMPTGQSDGGSSSAEVPSFQVTSFVCGNGGGGDPRKD